MTEKEVEKAAAKIEAENAKQGGRALSNLYELTLPKKSPKKAANDVDKSVGEDESTVHERDRAGSIWWTELD